MKKYPTIDRRISSSLEILAFDKLDGSNIRAEWYGKRGFHKFGSRNQLIDETHPFLGEAPSLIMEKYSEQLSKILFDMRLQKAVCYFEFFGENSFAGNHENEPHDVVLLDVSIHKKGLMLPQEFVKTFEDVETAKLLYRGKANQDFVRGINRGALEGMSFEGVVCKSIEYKSPGMPYMFKIKSDQWLRKLKDFCGENEKLFKELM